MHKSHPASAVFDQLSPVRFSLSHKAQLPGIQRGCTGAKRISAKYFAVLLHPLQKIFAPPAVLVSSAQFSRLLSQDPRLIVQRLSVW